MSKVLVDGIPAKRLSEICRAEQEGRLVILPCKVGDTVYVLMKRNITTEIEKGTVRNVRRYNDGTWWVEFCDLWIDLAFERFGKTAFLNREEAEEALEKEKTAPKAATFESGTGK